MPFGSDREFIASLFRLNKRNLDDGQPVSRVVKILDRIRLEHRESVDNPTSRSEIKIDSKLAYQLTLLSRFLAWFGWGLWDRDFGGCWDLNLFNLEAYARQMLCCARHTDI